MHEVVTDFPLSSAAMIVWAVLLLVCGALFVQLLFSLLHHGRRKIIGSIFALLLVSGTIIHAYLLSLSHHTVVGGNVIQLIMVSFVAALEMFIAHIYIFDDIYAAVIFNEPGLMVAYITILALVLCYSFVMVIHILPRRLRDRVWLRRHQKDAHKNRRIHIFLGISNNAKLLSSAIVRHCKEEGRKVETIIFVDFPERRGIKTEFALGDIFTRMTIRRQLSLEEEIGTDKIVFLKGSLPDPQSNEPFCKALGLSKLYAFLENSRTNLYIIGDDVETNASVLGKLLESGKLGCKIFCQSNMPASYDTFYQSSGNRVYLLDPEALAVNRWKVGESDIKPINFVDVARDSDGRPLGYVKEGIRAYIIGFGNTGREALKFLYEFSSFVDKDLNPVKNSFTVYDPEIEKVRGEFLNVVPGFETDKSIEWSSSAFGSVDFWDSFRRDLPKLNYVILATDSPSDNMDMAASLLKAAAREGRDWQKFTILIRVLEHDSQIQEMVDFYNRMYTPEGQPVLRIFGNPADIWDPEVITGRHLKRYAKKHFEEYQAAIGSDETWEGRRKRLFASENKLAARKELMRRQWQDISSSLYADTLHKLGGPDVAASARQIPTSMGDWESFKPHDYDVLERLAAASHLRYVNSHIAGGYLGGPIDELKQIVPDLVSYKESSTDSKFAAWIDVKSSFLDAK